MDPDVQPPTEEPPRLAPSSTRRRVWTVLRFLLMAAPLYWIGRRIDAISVVRHLSGVGALALAVLVLAPLSGMLLSAARWRALMSGFNATTLPRFSFLLSNVVVGQYLNMLPGAVAGDAVRAVRTDGFMRRKLDAWAVIVAERLSGLLGLLVLAAMSLAWEPDRHLSAALTALGVGAAVAAALAAALFGAPPLYRRWAPAPIAALGALDRLVRSFPTPTAWVPVAVACALSVTTQGLVVVQVAAIVSDLTPGVDVAAVTQMVPALMLLTYIPVTPGAVGQREVVFVELLGGIGVPPAAAVTASVLVFAAHVVTVLVGAALLGLRGPRDVTARAAPTQKS